MDTKSAVLYGLGAAMSIVAAQMLALWANLMMSNRTPVFTNSVLIPALILGVTGIVIVRSRLVAQRAAQ